MKVTEGSRLGVWSAPTPSRTALLLRMPVFVYERAPYRSPTPCPPRAPTRTGPIPLRPTRPPPHCPSWSSPGASWRAARAAV